MQPLYVVNKKGETVPLDGEWLVGTFQPALTALTVAAGFGLGLLSVITFLLLRLAQTAGAL